MAGRKRSRLGIKKEKERVENAYWLWTIASCPRTTFSMIQMLAERSTWKAFFLIVIKRRERLRSKLGRR
jgi:hypothetical protein